jgi:hypothetical protein
MRSMQRNTSRSFLRHSLPIELPIWATPRLASGSENPEYQVQLELRSWGKERHDSVQRSGVLADARVTQKWDGPTNTIE